MPDIGRIIDFIDRSEALALPGDSFSPVDHTSSWPKLGRRETILEVDYSRLFPRARPTDRGERDFHLYGDDWELSEEATRSILHEPGSLGPPEWDVWAWYQPIYFFGSQWGIYIRESGLVECARRIGQFLPPDLPGAARPDLLAKALVRAAFAALFLHEQYHHKTESLGIRLHVVERHAVYPVYHSSVYRATKGTDDQLEEGLANADSWFRITDPTYARWAGRTIASTARDYLEESFWTAPPGYRNARHLLFSADFEAEQHRLFAEVQEGPTPTRTTPSEFGIATHLNHSLFNVTQRIWTLVPRGAHSILPTQPLIAPLETRTLERYIEREGWRKAPQRGDGSHSMFGDSSGRMITLPKSKDVSLPVLKTTAATLGLSMHELKSRAGRRKGHVQR
jgi:predicted RNA binding protein YcfA (HicA-like mRNA interferase family)